MKYYATDGTLGVIFRHKKDRDDFCVGSTFRPVSLKEFSEISHWMVRDFSKYNFKGGIYA